MFKTSKSSLSQMQMLPHHHSLWIYILEFNYSILIRPFTSLFIPQIFPIALRLVFPTPYSDHGISHWKALLAPFLTTQHLILRFVTQSFWQASGSAD